MQQSVIETLTGAYVSSTDNTVTYNGLNSYTALDQTTTPPVSKHSIGMINLASGAGTIDLTTLPSAAGVAGAVTFNGLTVNAYKVVNPAANTGTISLTAGATNPYLLHGTAWKFTLRPGEELQWKGTGQA